MSSVPRGLYLVGVALVLMVSLITGAAGSAIAAQPEKEVPMVRVNLPGALRNHTDPLVSYLERETGAKVAITFISGSEAITKAMANNVVDIATFGGLEYAQLWARYGAKPLLQIEIWRTAFVTHADSKINSLKDLKKGHSFAFGGATSASSRVMPEYFMREAKVDMEVIEDGIARMERRGEVGHDNMHEGVVWAVAKKEVDAGALDKRFYDAMLRDGRITSKQVRLFYEPPPYPNSVWAVRKDFDPKLAENVANAFVKLDANNPAHKVILSSFRDTQGNLAKFFRSKDSEFEVLRKAAKADGLLK